MVRFLLRLVAFGLCVSLFAVFVLRYQHVLPVAVQDGLGLSAEVVDIRTRQKPRLSAALEPIGADVGSPVYIRVFKEEAELELWVKSNGQYALFRTYPICNYSGELGPKLREGDRQSPEGFYRVGKHSLNPNSQYHLSFNLGFPNAFDAAHDRTGSFLMIHGACASVGCYAMTDPVIEEIYVMVEAALNAGQSHVPVHAFPFRMTPDRMVRARTHPWIAFWAQLQPAFAAFETTRQVPDVTIRGKDYLVSSDQG